MEISRKFRKGRYLYERGNYRVWIIDSANGNNVVLKDREGIIREVDKEQFLKLYYGKPVYSWD